MSRLITDSPDSIKNTDSFSNKTLLCNSQRRAAVLIISGIFFGEIKQTTDNIVSKTCSINLLIELLDKISFTFAVVLIFRENHTVAHVILLKYTIKLKQKTQRGI